MKEKQSGKKTAASQKKNQTKSRKQHAATRPCYTLKCALLMFLCIIVCKGAESFVDKGLLLI